MDTPGVYKNVFMPFIWYSIVICVDWLVAIQTDSKDEHELIYFLCIDIFVSFQSGFQLLVPSNVNKVIMNYLGIHFDYCG